jgi:glyceraldehyde-3-phosphate dehydrogenase/erythrose-4-phosphate dehydrogenase
MSVKVVVNGYGTIGKRVADAAALQSDMEVVGVAKTRPNFEARGFPCMCLPAGNLTLRLPEWK